MSTTTNPTSLVAIEVKFTGPTNNRGARYTATGNGHRVTVSADYGLNASGNAARAARALADKFGWADDGQPAYLGSTACGWVVVFGVESGRVW